MEVGIIFKIGAVGILVSVLCQVLKHSGREEQAVSHKSCGSSLVLFWMVPYIYQLFEYDEGIVCVVMDSRNFSVS